MIKTFYSILIGMLFMKIIDSPVNYNVILDMRGGTMLYKIGDFSKLVNISVKTLRYYDDIDLFKPADVDLFTGYRYYKKEQIKDLELINKLKMIGFSLEEIKTNWNDFNDDVLQNKKKQLLEEIELKYNAIKEIDKLRSTINNKNEIKIKSLY